MAGVNSGYAWWLDPKIMGKSLQQTPYKGGSGYTGAGADGIVQPLNRVGALGNGSAVDEGEFVHTAQETQAVGKDLLTRISELAKTGGFTPQVANTMRTAVGLPAEKRMFEGSWADSLMNNGETRTGVMGEIDKAGDISRNAIARQKINLRAFQSSPTNNVGYEGIGISRMGSPVMPSSPTDNVGYKGISIDSPVIPKPIPSTLPTAAPLAKTPSFDEMNRQRALGSIRDIMTGQSQPFRAAANVGQQGIAQQGAAGQEALEQSLAQKGIEGGAALAAGMGQQRETGMRQAEFAGQVATSAQQQMAQAAGTLATESLAGVRLKNEQDQFAINKLLDAGDFAGAAKAFTQATGQPMDTTKMQKAYDDKNWESQMDKSLAAKDYTGYAAAYKSRFGTDIDLTNITSADQLDRISKSTIALTNSVASGGHVGDATTDAVLNNLWQASGKTGAYDPAWGQGQIDAAIKAADPVYQQLNSINEDTWRTVFNDAKGAGTGSDFVDNYKGGWEQLKSDIYMTSLTGGVKVDASGNLSLDTNNAFAQKILGTDVDITTPKIDITTSTGETVSEDIDTTTMLTSSGLPVYKDGNTYKLQGFAEWSKGKNITDPANKAIMLRLAENDDAGAIAKIATDTSVLAGLNKGDTVYDKVAAVLPIQTMDTWVDVPVGQSLNLNGEIVTVAARYGARAITNNWETYYLARQNGTFYQVARSPANHETVKTESRQVIPQPSSVEDFIKTSPTGGTYDSRYYKISFNPRTGIYDIVPK